MIKQILRYQFSSLLILALVLSGCSAIKTVDFESLVDTTSKPIDFQIKKTYKLEDDGVYVSNEFTGARLNGFERKNDSTAIVIIKPENSPINNSAYYAFKAWSKNARSFYFEFNYPEYYKHRYMPKIKENGNWRVLDSSRVYKNDSIFTIKLNLTDTPITISAQEIQSSNDVNLWVSKTIEGKDYVRLKSYGKSTLGIGLPVLDIYKGDKKGKDIVVLLTRQHPPEVTGYYAFQEFLKTILDDSDLAATFLNKYRVLAFPIMNPDGVDLGHWRHNANGIDTNRDWSKYNQSEIKQAVQFIATALKKDHSKVLLGLDFHSTYEDVFYTNDIRKSTTLPNFIDDWFTALERNIPDYKVNEKSSNSTKPVSKGWFLYGHNAVGITYEIGDATPKDKIQLIGKVSAEQMMKILNQAVVIK
ncbi:M14 family metallopeptidase [Gelidibacter mesophilus]|uniref:M14 family metallopeptidase n=1 Tax=Gelidibacter mesophilus TaxID=169050 RepID=UPI0004003EEB|nr:M14 family metallopeptidase [Gelidibacter mesophilus]